MFIPLLPLYIVYRFHAMSLCNLNNVGFYSKETPQSFPELNLDCRLLNTSQGECGDFTWNSSILSDQVNDGTMSQSTIKGTNIQYVGHLPFSPLGCMLFLIRVTTRTRV